MADENAEELQESIDSLGASLVKIKSEIRQLKKDGAPADKVKGEVTKMKALDAELKALQEQLAGPKFDQQGLQDVLLRRMIVVPSFEIHGGVSGLFDFGPIGTSLKDNIVSEWKKHFVLKERMLQVEATCMTSEPVLRASGHVERFTDLMVKDESTGFCYRADKLLEDHIENLLEASPGMDKEEKAELERVFRQADAYSPEELGALISERFKITAPDTGNVLSQPFPFNLMFKTLIGPEGTNVGFLRPETAQGIFVNFKRLLDYNYGKLPFAAAQIGLGFRNEIAPRAGLLRVREFTMAEIEHFVHPEEKDHPSFAAVADLELSLFPEDNQMTTGKLVKMTAGAAVAAGVINNQTLAYFMARTHLFLERIGIDMSRVRFRQHLKTEMAHYSSDCWDAEIHMSYGWTECVGHADRAAYDLRVHSEATNNDLRAIRQVDPPRVEEYAKISPNKKALGKAFKRDAGLISAAVAKLSMADALALGEKLKADGSAPVLVEDGRSFDIASEMLTIEQATRTVHSESFYPNVIEPSFGIGRILYAVLEHTFYLRGAAQGEEKAIEKGSVERTAFRFNPRVAPVKCGVCPVRKSDDQEAIVLQLVDDLVEAGIYATADVSSTAIGKKYSRFDEVGIPFCLTADEHSQADASVTLRERDSQDQIRAPISEALELVRDLCAERTTFEQLIAKYGKFTA